MEGALLSILCLAVLAGGCERRAEPLNLEPIDAAGLKALRANGSSRLRLVNLWATWCGPCVRELPELASMARGFKDRGLDLVLVAANYPDEREEALSLLRKAGAAGPSYIFGSEKKYDLLEAFDPEWEGGLPYTLLLRPGGEVLYRRTGELDLSDLRATIEKALERK